MYLTHLLILHNWQILPDSRTDSGDVSNRFTWTKCSIVTKTFKKLYELVREFVPLSHLILEHLGGAVSEVGPTDTAWVHRDKLYSILVRVNSKDDFPDKPVFIGANKFFESTKMLLGHNESYQNYLDDSMSNFLRRYYGINLERLVAVKKNVDPENVFHNPMTIPVHLH